MRGAEWRSDLFVRYDPARHRWAVSVETGAGREKLAGRSGRQVYGTDSHRADQLLERVLNAIADRGYREVITYTFVDPALQRSLFPGTPALALANPLSAELGEMRVSLWTGLLNTCRENLRRQQNRVRLFELGNKFLLHGREQGSALNEVETLAGIAAESRQQRVARQA